MIMVTLKTRSRSNLWHAGKGLVIMHLECEYPSVPLMVIDLGTHLSIPLVIMEKLNFDLKFRNEDTVTLSWVCLFIFSKGIHRSDMEALGPVVSKLRVYSGENPLNSTENVFCCSDLNRDQTDLVAVSWVVLQKMIKFLKTQR